MKKQEPSQKNRKKYWPPLVERLGKVVTKTLALGMPGGADNAKNAQLKTG